jgi:PAS domain-containing protein
MYHSCAIVQERRGDDAVRDGITAVMLSSGASPTKRHCPDNCYEHGSDGSDNMLSAPSPTKRHRPLPKLGSDVTAVYTPTLPATIPATSDDDEATWSVSEGTCIDRRISHVPSDHESNSRYKQKNRDNARKNRLRKKVYVTALEEGMVKLVCAVKSLREVVRANIGEAAVPSHVSILVDSVVDSVREQKYHHGGSTTNVSSFSKMLRMGGVELDPIISQTPAPTTSKDSDVFDFSTVSAPTISDASPLHCIHSLQNGFFVTNPNLVNNPLIFCDSGFERLTGYSKEDILGKNISFLMKVRPSVCSLLIFTYMLMWPMCDDPLLCLDQCARRWKLWPVLIDRKIQSSGWNFQKIQSWKKRKFHPEDWTPSSG